MENKVCFGYREKSQGFYITENFQKPLFFYFEEHDGYTFERVWGSKNNSYSAIRHKNLAFFGSHNRKEFWRFYIYQGEKTFFIERRGSCFEYGVYYVKTCESEIFTIRLDGEEFEKDLSITVSNKRQPFLSVEEIVVEMLNKHNDLYEKINDKSSFREELKCFCEEIVDGTETFEELQEMIEDSKRYFVNYSNNEILSLTLTKEVNLKFILEKFPLLKAYVDKIDLDAMLEEQRNLFSPALCECTIDDWLAEFVEKINFEIGIYEFNCKRDCYNSTYLLDKYSEKISTIVGKEEFLRSLENELIRIKENSWSCEAFFDKIEHFIDIYTNKELQERKTQAFIAEYGSNYVTINLTDEKKRLFSEESNFTKLSDEEKREYTLYQRLKQAQAKEMYSKNGKTIKPSFSAIPKLIAVAENLKETAMQANLISLGEGRYEFVSFDEIEKFVGLCE
ncbi:MAG: hypothetical protein E7659_02330 [Ruminococcaceae bacterium]|nr:hypothetical protein [Oscillospiraceae bacterium]